MHQLFNLLISIWLLSYCPFLSYAYWLFIYLLPVWWWYYSYTMAISLCRLNFWLFDVCSHRIVCCSLFFCWSEADLCAAHVAYEFLYSHIFALRIDLLRPSTQPFPRIPIVSSHTLTFIDSNRHKGDDDKKKHCINWRYLWHFYLTRYHRADRPVPYWEICSVCLH